MNLLKTFDNILKLFTATIRLRSLSSLGWIPIHCWVSPGQCCVGEWELPVSSFTEFLQISLYQPGKVGLTLRNLKSLGWWNITYSTLGKFVFQLILETHALKLSFNLCNLIFPYLTPAPVVLRTLSHCSLVFISSHKLKMYLFFLFFTLLLNVYGKVFNEWWIGQIKLKL